MTLLIALALLHIPPIELTNHYDTYICVFVYNPYTYMDIHIYTLNTTSGTIKIPKDL